MIKFFRKIRRRLLSENNFSKYLIYAIGEIILVVVGILIALQINTANENRKLNEKRANYYHQLILDLESDKEYSKSLIIKFEADLKLYMDYKDSFEEGGLDASKTMFNISKLNYSTVTMDYEANTIKTLVNTGNIGLLPQDVNTTLTTYLGHQNKMVDGNNGNAREIIGILRNASMSGANPSLRERIQIHPELIGELGIKANYPKIILELEAYHLWKENTSKTSISRLNDLIKDADSAIDVIKKKLEK